MCDSGMNTSLATFPHLFSGACPPRTACTDHVTSMHWPGEKTNDYYQRFSIERVLSRTGVCLCLSGWVSVWLGVCLGVCLAGRLSGWVSVWLGEIGRAHV